ncbi:quinone oxidoreductase-like protein 2 isoform X2 [Tripterygium wilfordii]|uniref:quinone oxidoreductase-like protein 2 isoform X2 n=1 Tax=Tripterygium wilfordii TaxID=458696 RepID=UPI0018F7ED12|nr:quinone oxidoreductase-like protein 2 isoform X2 [Tripterygium wilfordii]
MEALICRKLGDPAVLASDPPAVLSKSEPIPQLNSPTAVRVRVRATSLNYANYLQILGKYQEKPPLPFIPGSDYSGVVEAVGTAVSKFKVGDRVCSFAALGSFAQFIVADHSDLGAEKVNFLRSLGVDHVVDLSSESVTSSIKGFLKAKKLKGVDVLYDPVGGKLTKETMKLLNWGAQILVIGFASGEIPVIPANIALVKNWTVHGLYWGSYKIHQPNVLEDSIMELLSWMAKGLITIQISHTYCLSEASLAFAAIKERKAIGKVLIAFDEDARSKL